MNMDVRKRADETGAVSIEKVAYRDTFKHVCYSATKRGGLDFVEVHMEREHDGTLHATCANCKRMFYSTPGKYRPREDGYAKQHNVPQRKQFAYA